MAQSPWIGTAPVVITDAANATITDDGTTLASPYTTNSANVVAQDNQLYTPSWNDTLEKTAGRAIMISFQFGLTKHEK